MNEYLRVVEILEAHISAEAAIGTPLHCQQEEYGDMAILTSSPDTVHQTQHLQK